MKPSRSTRLSALVASVAVSVLAVCDTVQSQGFLPAPTIAAIEPGIGRPGSTFVATVSGARLSEVISLSIAGEGVEVSIEPGEIVVRLSVRITISPDAPPGVRAVTVDSRFGTHETDALFYVCSVS